MTNRYRKLNDSTALDRRLARHSYRTMKKCLDKHGAGLYLSQRGPGHLLIDHDPQHCAEIIVELDCDLQKKRIHIAQNFWVNHPDGGWTLGTKAALAGDRGSTVSTIASDIVPTIAQFSANLITWHHSIAAESRWQRDGLPGERDKHEIPTREALLRSAHS